MDNGLTGTTGGTMIPVRICDQRLGAVRMPAHGETLAESALSEMLSG